jgi:DNA ligase-associated metallophosphoesterase
MSAETLEVALGRAPALLLADKAVWLPRQRWLLVADVHIGKAVSFRRLGVPVPHGTTADTLQRLDALVQRWSPERLVVLGDFLHSARARAPGTMDTLAGWRRQRAALPITLVRGNHDDRAGDPPVALGIEVVDGPLHVDGLALAHEPRPEPGEHVLGGHLHPCVRLGTGFDRLRLPCFWLGREVTVLPAFGAFTGMHPVQPADGDAVVAIADGRLARLPQKLRA